MTLEYREIRGFNVKSFFNRRCPRRRRRIFLSSLLYANNALWYTAFTDDTMVCKRVRGWTLWRSLPVLNFVKPPPLPFGARCHKKHRRLAARAQPYVFGI